MKILVTGAAGRVGNVVATGLRENGHRVAVHDLAAEIPGFTAADTVRTGDLADLDELAEITSGMDAVCHLGGDPGGGATTKVAGSDGSWTSILNANIVGTYNIFEACRRSGVRRVAYASRAGLLGGDQ